MSLTAQTIRTILAALAVSVVIVASAGKAATQEEPKKATGSTVRGVVTYSDTGRPLRNARIALMRDADGDTASEGNTDDRGEFVLVGIPAGSYVLLVDAPGILKPQGFKTPKNGVIAQLRLYDKRDLFTEVIVNGTDSVEVKIQAVRGGVITGRVVTDDDQPLPKADINLLRRENGEWLPLGSSWNFLRRQKEFTTDPSGVYRIAGLPAGDYLVRVSEENVRLDGNPPLDDAYSRGSMMMTYHPSATSVAEAQAITVVEGSESNGVDIRLPPLTPYSISGRIIGPDNEPGTRARIRIARKDELRYLYDDYDVYAYADTDGNWRIPGVPAGEYVITIGDTIEVGPPESSRYRMVAPKRISVRVANGDVVVPDIKLSNGATVSGKMLVDGKPPKLTYDTVPYLISAGDVADRRGASIHQQSPTRFRVFADPEDGSFHVSGVPAGKYWFETSVAPTEKLYLKSVTRKGVDLMQSPLRLKDEALVEDLVISIATDFASIEGEIAPVEEKRKHSLRDAIVLLAPATAATRRISAEPRMVQADAQGNFGFNAPPGEYFVIALTPADIKKLPPINDDYFKNESKKFTRVKVRGAEKLKGLRIPIGVN
jgi:hypothetical protein